jgi:hypothetical protein
MMRLFLSRVAFLTVLTASGFSSRDGNATTGGQPENTQPATAAKQQQAVRYDGLYQSEKEGDHWYYLRFYEDATVLSVTSVGTPAQVARWFNKQYQYGGKGTYSIDGDHIKFSETSRDGIVDHEGAIIEGGKLKLNSHSHINDHRGTQTYQFVEQKMSGE